MADDPTVPAEYDIVTVAPATADDCFFLDAWNRSFEGSVARANEALNRVLTLSTAMTGGSLVLLKEDICYGWWKVAAAALFFAALAVAVLGSVPVAVAVEFDPTSVRAKLSHAAAVKRRWLWAASACLVAGSLAAVVGVAAHAYVGPTPATATPATTAAAPR